MGASCSAETQEYKLPNVYQGTIQSTPAGKLIKPSSCAYLLDGDLAILGVDHAVHVYSPDGTFRRTLLSPLPTAQWGAGDHVKRPGIKTRMQLVDALPGDTIPGGLAVMPESGNLVVSNAAKDLITIVDPTSGATVAEFGEYGVKEGQLNRPMGVDVSDIGEIYVADSCNCRVQIFSETGEFIDAFGGGDVLAKPVDVCVAEDGMFVADMRGHKIVYFDIEGKVEVPPISRLTLYGVNAIHVVQPPGCTDSRHSWVVLTTFNGNVIEIYDEDADLVQVIGGAYGDGDGEMRGTSAIAVSTDRKVLAVCDLLNNRVHLFSSSTFGTRDKDSVGVATPAAELVTSLMALGRRSVVEAAAAADAAAKGADYRDLAGRDGLAARATGGADGAVSPSHGGAAAKATSAGSRRSRATSGGGSGARVAPLPGGGVGDEDDGFESLLEEYGGGGADARTPSHALEDKILNDHTTALADGGGGGGEGSGGGGEHKRESSGGGAAGSGRPDSEQSLPHTEVLSVS